MALGIYKLLIHLFFEFINKLGFSKFLKDNISKNLFELCNSNIDFLPTTMLNECKTTDSLTSDFIRTMKIWLWMHRNIDIIIEKHFNVNNYNDSKNVVDTHAYTLTIYKIIRLTFPSQVMSPYGFCC